MVVQQFNPVLALALSVNGYKRMRNFTIFILILVVQFSCNNKVRTVQNNYGKFSGEIYYRDYDPEYQWTRILLKDNDKWGYIDKDSNIVIPFIYDFLNQFDAYGYAIVENDGKCGFINRNNDTIIPLIYEEIGSYNHDLARAKLNGKHGFINRKGETIIDFQFDDAHGFIDCGLAQIKIGNKYGFVDTKGFQVIPAKYSKVDYHPQEMDFVFALHDNKWAFFSTKGEQLSDFVYDDIYGTSEHIDIFTEKYMFNELILVKKNGKYGYLNRNLKVVIDFGYFSKAEQITEHGFAIVKKGSFYGVIDKTGKLIIPLEYSLIKHPSRPYQGYYNEFYIKKNGKVGLLNENAEFITEIIYDWFERDYCKINDTIRTVFHTKKGNKFGIIDSKGNIIVPIEYDEISLFEGNKLTIAKKTEKYGLINGNGTIIKPVEYKSIYTYKDLDYYIIQTENYYGMLDKQSLDTIFPLEFQDIEQCFYDENRFIVKKNGFYGIITREMKEIYPFEFDKISNWVEYGPDEHFVVKNGKHGLISREGKIVIPPIYDDIEVDNRLLIKVKNNNLYGTINWKNEIIHPIEYEQIQWIWPYLDGNGLDSIYVEKSGKYYITNNKGEVIKSNISEKEFIDKFGFYIEIENEEYILPPIPEREYEIIEDEEFNDY